MKRNVAISMGTVEVNGYGMTEAAGGSRRFGDVQIPVSMDEIRPFSRNPLCSVSYLDPRLGTSSLSVPIPC